MPKYFVWSIASTIERANYRGLTVARPVGRRALIALAMISRRLLNAKVSRACYLATLRIEFRC